MVCILEEMVREPGVKFAQGIICRVQGMAKRKWLCSVMKHTSLIEKKTNNILRLTVQIESQRMRSQHVCVFSQYCDVIEHL